VNYAKNEDCLHYRAGLGEKGSAGGDDSKWNECGPAEFFTRITQGSFGEDYLASKIIGQARQTGGNSS